jgi:Peptidase_C39 like family
LNTLISAIKNARFRLLCALRQFNHHLSKNDTPLQFLHKNVPYFSQWESRDLNQKICEFRIKAESDPKWRDSGARTTKEYADWSWSGCGMACLKMILIHSYGTSPKLVELGKKCASYGGYIMPLETGIGLIYAPFLTFIKTEFGLVGKVYSPLLLQDIFEQLSHKRFVIASVSHLICQPIVTPKFKGGHLVLVLGYDLTKQEIYLHNPSGPTILTQEYTAVRFADFNKSFSRRGIVISSTA